MYNFNTSKHRGRKRPIHSSSSPKHLLQNVISDIFTSSSHRVYRLEISNFLPTVSHVGIFDPAFDLYSPHVAPLPFSLVQHSPPFLWEQVQIYLCNVTVSNKGGRCILGGEWASVRKIAAAKSLSRSLLFSC